MSTRSRPGAGEDLRRLQGQGLPGDRSSATTSAAVPKSHGSHNVRAPGSIGASATPTRVMKGIRGPGQMGNKRITQRGLEVVEVRAQENLLFVRGSVPGPRNSWWRCGPMADAPVLGTTTKRRKTVKLDADAFGARFNGPLVHESVRAEQAARRRGSAATKTRGNGLRRRRQAVAPEGHRSRPRRLVALADLDRRRHRVRAPPALLCLQGQPQGAPRRAAQRAVAARRARLARGPRCRRLPRPSTHAAAALLAGWKEPRGNARRARARGARCRAVVPQPRARGGARAENVGVADISAPRRCCAPTPGSLL
jgi:hypothetical protein